MCMQTLKRNVISVAFPNVVATVSFALFFYILIVRGESPPALLTPPALKVPPALKGFAKQKHDCPCGDKCDCGNCQCSVISKNGIITVTSKGKVTWFNDTGDKDLNQRLISGIVKTQSGCTTTVINGKLVTVCPNR